MLTQCPACHARAQLSDWSAGAKVRCGECGSAYIALPAGRAGERRASRKRTALIAVVLTGLAGAVALPLLKRASASGPPPAGPPRQAGPDGPRSPAGPGSGQAEPGDG
jgi:hypothetical protein